MIIVLVLGLVLGLTILLVRTDVRDELDKIGRTPEWIINWTTDGEAKQISARGSGRHPRVGLDTYITGNKSGCRLTIGLEHMLSQGLV